MISFLNKFLYSKCPYCHEHGIFFIKINTRGTGLRKCKCCNKKVFVHSGISLICAFTLFLILFALYKKIFYNILENNIYIFFGYFLGIFILYLAEYFAYLEKIDDNKDSSE